MAKRGPGPDLEMSIEDGSLVWEELRDGVGVALAALGLRERVRELVAGPRRF